MNDTAAVFIGISAIIFLYTYFGYPALLWIMARGRRSTRATLTDLPLISVSLPVYNEEAQIRDVIESLLRLDYPADRRQIVVVSDASSDRTDEIVKEYASRGIEFLQLPQRSGKTAAENAAAQLLQGEIIINTDASVRIRPDAVRHLVAQFADPTIGVASARDVSVSSVASDLNVGEAGYVGYEMAIRKLETRLGGIIGASGCLYAVRAHLHRQPLPDHLSRDFAAALIAREHGYRAVSVDEAVCLVPRTHSLHREYSRKVRTISRGMETLMYKSHLLNPLRYGVFAWKLLSHKVCRWITPALGLLATTGLLLAAVSQPWARLALAALVICHLLAFIGWSWPDGRTPRTLAFFTSAVSVQVATAWAMIKALHGDKNAAWEPTRRIVAAPPQSAA